MVLRLRELLALISVDDVAVEWAEGRNISPFQSGAFIVLDEYSSVLYCIVLYLSYSLVTALSVQQCFYYLLIYY